MNGNFGYWHSTRYRGPAPDHDSQNAQDVIEKINTEFITEGQATYRDLIERYVLYGDLEDLARALDKVTL